MKADHVNGLTLAQQERLTMFAEEASEIVKAVTKILRHGFESINPDAPQDGTNRDQLRKEYIDLAAVGSLMMEAGDIPAGTREELRDAKDRKLFFTHYQDSSDEG